MAAAYTNSATDVTPATTVVINPAASANDVILCGLVADNSGVTISGFPTGFSTIAGPQDTTFDAQTAVVTRKKLASGAEGSLTHTLSGSAIGAMISFSGVDNTTTEDVAPVVTNSNVAANPKTLTASITPTTNGCEIVMFAFGDIGSGGDVTFTFTELTTVTLGLITKRQDIQSGFYNMAVAHANQATAGLCTVQVSGASTSTMAMSLMLVALRPAAGGGGIAAVSFLTLLGTGA